MKDAMIQKGIMRMKDADETKRGNKGVKDTVIQKGVMRE